MGIRDWLRPREATVPELEEQLERAREAHAAAHNATQAAQDTFDAEGSDAAAKALTKAREAEAFAVEHLARAERLLTAGREREEAARLAAMRSEFDKLLGSLSPERFEEEGRELVTREADLLAELAQVRRGLSKAAGAVDARQRRLRELAEALDLPEPHQTTLHCRLGTPGLVWDEIKARAVQMEDRDARWLVAQVPSLAEYHPASDTLMVQMFGLPEAAE